MSYLKQTILFLIIPATACALAGCEQPGDGDRGTYTAARHMRTGSNVPQASDANSTDSVYRAPTGNNIGGTSVNSSGGGR